MNVRRFMEEDAKEVSRLIIRTLRVSNSGDYPPEVIEDLVSAQRPEDILIRAENAHLYVAEEDGEIAGCGAIRPYEGREDESFILSFFVLPEYQRKGVGKLILQALEIDGLFLRAGRTELHASSTGLGFYLKMGYRFSGGCENADENGLYHLEKSRLSG